MFTQPCLCQSQELIAFIAVRIGVVQQPTKTNTSHWNHRVVKLDTDLYGIKEVHYNSKGKPFAYGESYLTEESVDDLRLTLTRMLEALNRPVLTKEDFKHGW